MKYFVKTNLPIIAFLLLFTAEFTYYLLILQTGIVEYHHSDISEIWMIPLGGILGIIASIFLYTMRHWLIPSLLFVQLLISFDYTVANGFELFILGVISGLTAPILIAHIDKFWVVLVSLALSYSFGTYVFEVVAIERTNIALILSSVALLASFFSQMNRSNTKKGKISLYSMGNVFLWLLLDASLFETISRDSVMQLWGEASFVWIIIFSHIVGLYVAFRFRNLQHNDKVLIGLFFITYLTYESNLPWALSIVYPFVISYYNVIILQKLISLSYVNLAVVSLSLWGASGLGLFIALSHSFLIAWIVLFLLAFNYVNRHMDKPFFKLPEALLDQFNTYIHIK
jgi:hypothetical protein